MLGEIQSLTMGKRMTRENTDHNETLKDPAEFPGWTNLGGGDVARRSVMKGAAWSLPVMR